MVIIFDKTTFCTFKITLFSAPETTKLHRGACIIRLLYNLIFDATVLLKGNFRSTSMHHKGINSRLRDNKRRVVIGKKNDTITERLLMNKQNKS